MQTRSFTLEQVHIPTPCDTDWSKMTGDAQKRFCDACGKHVHNLSAMSRDEAERLVNSSEKICVQFARTASGQTLTTEPAISGWRRWSPLAIASMALSATLAMVGCDRRANAEVMGKMQAMPATQPAVEVLAGEPVRITRGDVCITPPSTQPAPEVKLGEAVSIRQGFVAPRAPATQPAPEVLMGTPAPVIRGQISITPPATQPATQPTTQPDAE